MMAKKKKSSKKKKTEHYRTGQYVKPKSTGKVTTNLSQKDWEKVPGTGTSPTNPPKYKMKEEARAKQQSKFKVKQAKEREKPTQVAVESLYEAAGEGAPYARLTAAVRRGAKEAAVRRGAKEEVTPSPRPAPPEPKVTIKELRPVRAQSAAYLTEDEKKENEKLKRFWRPHSFALNRPLTDAHRQRESEIKAAGLAALEAKKEGVTTPPRKSQRVEDLFQLEGLMSDPNFAGKTGGTIKRKSGGALGTGAALRGYGKGYKKGGTI